MKKTSQVLQDSKKRQDMNNERLLLLWYFEVIYFLMTHSGGCLHMFVLSDNWGSTALNSNIFCIILLKLK